MKLYRKVTCFATEQIVTIWCLCTILCRKGQKSVNTQVINFSCKYDTHTYKQFNKQTNRQTTKNINKREEWCLTPRLKTQRKDWKPQVLLSLLPGVQCAFKWRFPLSNLFVQAMCRWEGCNRFFLPNYKGFPHRSLKSTKQKKRTCTVFPAFLVLFQFI